MGKHIASVDLYKNALMTSKFYKCQKCLANQNIGITWSLILTNLNILFTIKIVNRWSDKKLNL